MFANIVIYCFNWFSVLVSMKTYIRRILPKQIHSLHQPKNKTWIVNGSGNYIIAVYEFYVEDMEI